MTFETASRDKYFKVAFVFGQKGTEKVEEANVDRVIIEKYVRVIGKNN